MFPAAQLAAPHSGYYAWGITNSIQDVKKHFEKEAFMPVSNALTQLYYLATIDDDSGRCPLTQEQAKILEQRVHLKTLQRRCYFLSKKFTCLLGSAGVMMLGGGGYVVNQWRCGRPYSSDLLLGGLAFLYGALTGIATVAARKFAPVDKAALNKTKKEVKEQFFSLSCTLMNLKVRSQETATFLAKYLHPKQIQEELLFSGVGKQTSELIYRDLQAAKKFIRYDIVADTASLALKKYVRSMVENV